MLLVHSRLQHRLAARAVSGFLGFLGENVFLSSESAAPPQSHSTPFQAFFLLTPQLQSDHDATKSIQADLHAAAYRKCYAAAYRQCWPSEPKKKSFFCVQQNNFFPNFLPLPGPHVGKKPLDEAKTTSLCMFGEWTLKTKVERKRKWRWIFREYNFRQVAERFCSAEASSGATCAQPTGQSVYDALFRFLS